MNTGLVFVPFLSVEPLQQERPHMAIQQDESAVLSQGEGETHSSRAEEGQLDIGKRSKRQEDGLMRLST